MMCEQTTVGLPSPFISQHGLIVLGQLRAQGKKQSVEAENGVSEEEGMSTHH